MPWNGLPCQVLLIVDVSQRPLQISSQCSVPVDSDAFSMPGTPGIAAILQVVCQLPTSSARASCSFVFGLGIWAGAALSAWAGRNVAATSAARQRVIVFMGNLLLPKIVPATRTKW